MLPYLAQGANSAVEDGSVLGQLLGCIKTKSQIPKALNMYETLRKARGEAIVRETFKQVWMPPPPHLLTAMALLPVLFLDGCIIIK